MKAMSSVLEAIGNTPLVELARVTRSLPGRILLKLDYLNPGSSRKDRAALGIIRLLDRCQRCRRSAVTSGYGARPDRRHPRLRLRAEVPQH